MAKSSEIIKDALLENNPVMTQMLGVCSALAVTTKFDKSIVMALSLTAVVTCSNGIISALRNIIPSKIRMITELVVIASLVILVDQTLKAYMYGLAKELSVFVGLIITNCIVMGRAEAVALGNPVGKSLLDGVGNGLGYGVILLIVGGLREILGAGTLTVPGVGELKVIPEALYNAGFTNMGLMVLAPGAFFLIGILCWIQKEYLIRKGGQ